GAKSAINCFKSDPSVKSSLKFLRKTDWARAKVEALYIKTFSDKSALNADASGASNLWTSGAFKKN
ncbi:MAG: VF530 family protein, partial [Porticoccaceae bacterium]|nr:VF530 family protein [Porticoccaceae bacterium]